MKSIASIVFVLLSAHAHGVKAAAFVSSSSVIVQPRAGLHSTLTATQKSARESAFPESVDLKRARDCADHFGMCSLEEMEEMRSALHTERLKHFVDEKAGYKSDLDPEDEIGRLLLEEDLSLQLNLLKETLEEAGDVVGNPPYAMDSSIAVHHPIKALEEEQRVEETNQAVDQFNSMFALGNGVPEAIMLCVAVAALMTAPQLFHI